MLSSSQASFYSSEFHVAQSQAMSNSFFDLGETNSHSGQHLIFIQGRIVFRRGPLVPRLFQKSADRDL